jgi:hypothetical protein
MVDWFMRLLLVYTLILLKLFNHKFLKLPTPLGRLPFIFLHAPLCGRVLRSESFHRSIICYNKHRYLSVTLRTAESYTGSCGLICKYQDMTQYSLVDISQNSRGTSSLFLQCTNHRSCQSDSSCNCDTENPAAFESEVQLTSWNSALHEKPPVTQLLKNFTTFYGTRRVFFFGGVGLNPH